MKLCDYGCGEEGKFLFKNGIWCCSSHHMKCKEYKKTMIGSNNPFYGKEHNSKVRKNISLKNKGKEPWNRGVSHTEETIKKIKIKTKEKMNDPILKEQMKRNLKLNSLKKEKHPKWNGGYYNKNIPLYNSYYHQISYVEECRRNNEDPKILEVICTYCGKWFIPKRSSIYERIRASEGRQFGEQRLYCSSKCKRECSIFNQKDHPKKYDYSTEVQTQLRQMRFKIDNYICQVCKIHEKDLKVGLHCHHIEGRRWEPLESADIDKVITVCKNCHKGIHKKDGCGYNDMKCKK